MSDLFQWRLFKSWWAVPTLLLVFPVLFLLGAGGVHNGDPHSEVRGMTISCHGSGMAWGSDAMVATMAELKGMGVNWVAIHPYGGIRQDGTVSGGERGRRSRMYDEARWLTRPIEEAHRLGLKIMIKPHIAYWGSGFSWRGEIDFDSAEEWSRFFETYEAWITRVAELAKDADAFVVGTELDRTVRHEKEWRRIIEKVRAITEAPLTYAANWDSFERVKFWDALDAVGIQGYFPLVQHELVPPEKELDRAWGRLIGRLEKYGKQQNRPIILCELGYNRSATAAARPWEHQTGGEQAELVQRRCMAAALLAIEKSKIVTGSFLWKWFPGDGVIQVERGQGVRGSRGHGGRGNFRMSTAAMREVIENHWGKEKMAD